MGDAPPSNEAPIFVIGSSRSGTTLLRQMLSSHPRIHLTMEASFYLWAAAYSRWWDFDQFPPFYLKTFSYRWLRQDPRPVLAKLPRPFRRSDRSKLFTEVMRQQAALHNKPRFGDKTPSHSAFLTQIFKDYPEAKVIRMVRDPRGVVSSLRRMPWSPGSLLATSTLVHLEARQVAPFRRRILEVTFDALTKDPRATLERVLDWVGEPFTPEVLDHVAHGPSDLPPVPWFASAARSAITSPAPPKLEPVELRLVELLARFSPEPMAEPLSVAAEPTAFAVIARFIQELPRALAEGVIGLGMAAAFCGSSLDAPVTETWLRRLNPRAWLALPGFHIPTAPALPDGWDASWPPLRRP